MMGIDSLDQLISSTAAVIHWLFIWSCQALLLLGLAWAGLKLDRSRSATTRYRIWLVALLVVAVLPLLSALSQRMRLPVALPPLPTEDFGIIAIPATVPQAVQPAFSWSSLFWPTLFVLWVSGVLISLLRLGNSIRRLHLIQSSARAVSLKDLDCSYSDLLHSDAGVSILLSDGIQSPGLAGLFHPVILLPADIMSWTSREERTAILRHEFAHIKRWDHIVSRFQPALRSLLFFHPLLRYADQQLSLEREIACDDRVLSLGAEPKAYAEAILKAAERSLITDVVHQAASFNSRKTLERRIEMIVNTNRMLQPLRQWPFLLLPIMLIGLSAWLVIPAASSQRETPIADSLSASNVPASAQSVADSSTSYRAQVAQVPAAQLPVVDRSTIIVAPVERGTMRILVRGLGLFVPDSGRLKAVVNILVNQARDIRIGQPASIDDRHDLIHGRVIDIGSVNPDGKTIPVDISLDDAPPQFARADMEIEGTIEISLLDNVLYVQKPGGVLENSAASIFRIDGDGATATRVPVKFGKTSITLIEILDGLNVGDKVIVTDMSRYAAVNSVRLK